MPRAIQERASIPVHTVSIQQSHFLDQSRRMNSRKTFVEEHGNEENKEDEKLEDEKGNLKVKERKLGKMRRDDGNSNMAKLMDQRYLLIVRRVDTG
jgi:hypothetical protein